MWSPNSMSVGWCGWQDDCPPKCLFPQTCKYITVHSKRDSVAVIKLGSREGRGFGMIRAGPVCLQNCHKWRRRLESPRDGQ